MIAQEISVTCPLCNAVCQHVEDGFSHEFGFEDASYWKCPKHGELGDVEDYLDVASLEGWPLGRLNGSQPLPVAGDDPFYEVVV